MDKTFAERPNHEGAKFVMSPPLREKSNQKVLWDALAQGFIDTVGTDHCPFDVEQKAMGIGDFTKIPNGMPAIEDRINLLYTYGVSRGNLDIHRFVDATSTRVAKLFGLESKGNIAIGKDADLVVYDPHYRGNISAKTQLMNNDYNPCEGTEIDGKPSVVTVRGKVAVKDGKFVGEVGRGKLLRRKVAR
jgi:dihydropyrimidinase